jgi:hypothetical protein
MNHFAVVIALAIVATTAMAQPSCSSCYSDYSSCTSSVQSSYNSCESSASRSLAWANQRCFSDRRSCTLYCEDLGDPQAKANCLMACEFEEGECMYGAQQDYNRAISECQQNASNSSSDCAASRDSCLLNCLGERSGDSTFAATGKLKSTELKTSAIRFNSERNQKNSCLRKPLPGERRGRMPVRSEIDLRRTENTTLVVNSLF